ncbi:MAG: oligosaccharide flippase family protein [Pseudomonadota bacterium]
MSAKRLIALQSVFYGFANGIEALVPFLLAPILTRSLDPTEYGLWVLFVTYSTFLRPIIGLTSQDAIRMRFYDFDQEQLDKYTHTIFYIMMVTVCVGTIITILFADILTVISKFPAPWLVTIVIAAFLFEVFYTALALHQFHEKRAEFLYTQIAQAVLSMTFIAIFLLLDWDWRGVILGRMIGMSIASLISLRFLGYGPTVFFKMPQRSFYRNIARFGLIYWPSGMVIMAMGMIDKVVAAHYIGVEASALYGVAALFASAFWVVNQSFILAWTPWLFRRLKNISDSGLRDVVSVSGAYFLAASVAGGIIYLLSIWVAPYLLGESFHKAIPLVGYIMIAIVLQGFFFHNMKFLHYEKSIFVMSTVSALALCLNLGLSILWAPESGVRGIMIATAVSFGVTFFLTGVIIAFRFARLRYQAA